MIHPPLFTPIYLNMTDRQFCLGKGYRPGFYPCVDDKQYVDANGKSLVDYVVDFSQPLPFNSSGYDVFTSFFVMDRVDQEIAKHLANEMYRMLVPGGKFIIIAETGLPGTPAVKEIVQEAGFELIVDEYLSVEDRHSWVVQGFKPRYELRLHTAVLYGRKMYLYGEDDDFICSYFFLDGEPFEHTLLPALVKRGDCVIDVGAHIGTYTLPLSDMVGPEGEVHAFEPESTNCFTLSKNVELNKASNVTLHNIGLLDRDGTVTLRKWHRNSGDNRMWSHRVHCREEEVAVKRFDDYLPNKSIQFVKIDVQGGELCVLRGMQKTIHAQKRLAMFVEYWPVGIQQMGGTCEEFWQLLSSFVIFRIDGDNRTLVLVEDWKTIVDPATDHFVNLLCIKR